ncbi:MAG: TonB family protein [Oligoflexia bacterium]|nr:TonB family protein [Bdellovibrionales bacterium]MYE07831.1 TonB family protein [Oligoflexia bacterium]
MFQNKNTRLNPFLYFFLGSLLIHGTLLLLIWSSPSQNTSLHEEDDIVFVHYPDHKQIVSQKNFNKITPQKQRPYLSQADKSVEKETQAMLKGLFYQAESPIQESIIKKSPLSSSNTAINRKISSLDPSPALLDKIASPIHIDISEINNTSIFPPQQESDLSRTMDFLPGVDPGSHTLLNTKEFTYYSYFSRMKEQLYWRWTQYFRTELHPFLIKLNTKKNTQKLFSTNLYVHLSPEGEVQDIRIVQGSGAEDIDSAALHAFLAAAPFPNPPKELIEEDGYIHIRQSFHLYISPSSYGNLFSRQN